MQGKDVKKSNTYDNRDPKLNFLHQKKQNQQNEYIIDNNGNRVDPVVEENEYKVTSRQSTVIIKKIAEDSARTGQQNSYPITLTAIGYAVNHALQILQTYKSTNSIVDNKVEIKMSTLIMEFEAIPLVEGLKPFDYSTVNGKITIKMTLNIQNKEEIEKRLNSIHVSNRVQRKRGYKNRKQQQGRGRGYINKQDNKNVSTNKNYNNKYRNQQKRVYKHKNNQNDNYKNQNSNQDRPHYNQQGENNHQQGGNNNQQGGNSNQQGGNNNHQGGNQGHRRKQFKNNKPNFDKQTRPNNNRGNTREKGNNNSNNNNNNNQNQTPQN